MDSPAKRKRDVDITDSDELTAPSDESDVQRRREKMKVWQASKLAPTVEATNAKASENDADVDDDADGESDDEADPLEAFMTELDSTEEIVPQQSVYDISTRGLQVQPPTSNTITLEDIMAWSAKVPGGEEGGEGWESDVPSDVGTETADDEDDETMDRDREEFMKTMRAMHAPKDEEMEANIAAVVAEGEKKDAIESDQSSQVVVEGKGDKVKKGSQKKELGRIFAEEGDVMEEHEREDQERSALELLQEAIKKKELAPVDHAQIDYIKIRKNLYVVPRVLAHLAQKGHEKELATKREELGIKVRGKGCPPPVDTWEQCGLSEKILKTIRKNLGEDSAPFAIQKQAVPTIMSGRDVIGIAKTGSGKTLAFLLPMIRHILDQPLLGEGEGPIGLIMAPARELAVQIFKEAKKLTKALDLRITAVYGGASIADQIGEMKRGAEIVVCTPGRMIDILTMQAGKLVSFSRVSSVVLDEADRMFDMGFEPQIRMILQNIRPDRQTCLFSATFPQKVEDLAKKALTAPLEIVVGGRSVVNSTITQFIEVREDSDKFMRLLQLLGVWYEKGHVIIFTDTQARCERLFQELMRAGYPCLSLHGGKEQIDRDDAIASFKNKLRTLLVATSVACRGLDVPECVCVINYSCPNHLEEYVHRSGRTGRAGRKGAAYTFITPEEDQYAPFLVKALKQSQQEVPEPLQNLADEFRQKVESGAAKWASADYGFIGNTGFSFDPNEKNSKQKQLEMQRRQYEVDQGLRDANELYSDDEEDEEDPEGAKEAAQAQAAAAAAAGSASSLSSGLVLHSNETPFELARKRAAMLASGKSGAVVPAVPQADAIQKALAQARKFAETIGSSSVPSLGTSSTRPPAIGVPSEHFTEEVVINDYPQKARFKITQRDNLDDVAEKFTVAIISRGQYIPPGTKVGPNEKKLYLSIEGHSELSVSGARREILRILNEETMRVGLDSSSSRYTVV